MITLSTERLILRDWCEDDIGCSVHNEDAIRYLIKVKNNYYVKTFAKADHNLLSDFYYYILEKNSNSF